MREKLLDVYVCPSCQSVLSVNNKESTDEKIISGKLVCNNNHEFHIFDGIPDLTYPIQLPEADRKARDEYDSMADKYEIYAPLPFMTYEVDEWETRDAMIHDLRIEKSSKVLEIGCGTGRSSKLIAKKLDSGELFLQEIAPKILQKAIENLSGFENTEFSLANGSYLPFADGYFDAAHHFGGLNTFSDITRCLSELARVTRVGGRVVVGDEGMAPWLRETQFGRIMMNSNPLLKYHPPLECLPVCACEVKVDWIVKGAFYALSFTVGEGEPTANYHLKIPSERGGSHWTRFYGILEGVSDEVKKIAYEARKKSGLSMHEWLDTVIKEASNNQLQNKEK